MLFVGDLSAEDVDQLSNLALHADSILEFGVGGSTHVIAQSKPRACGMLSIDTDVNWINRTKQIIGVLGISDAVSFLEYDDWCSSDTHAEASYDFIYNDGLSSLRQAFAFRSFRLLKPGGVMAFHDTRVPTIVDAVLEVCRFFFLEIGSVEFNRGGSNITVIKKRHKLKYVNWRKAEGLPDWSVGLGAPDEAINWIRAERDADHRIWASTDEPLETLRKTWERIDKSLMERLKQSADTELLSVPYDVQGIGTGGDVSIRLHVEGISCVIGIINRQPKTEDLSFGITLSVPEIHAHLFPLLRHATERCGLTKIGPPLRAYGLARHLGLDPLNPRIRPSLAAMSAEIQGDGRELSTAVVDKIMSVVSQSAAILRQSIHRQMS